MKGSPLVSIITPSYNQGEFIEETIKSVLSQDYPEIEYIVVDGGSNDNTIEILKKHEGKIKWVSEKDRGQSDAINKGFKIAKGEIFAWLNSDDIYLQGAVSKAITFFDKHPDVKLIYGDALFCDENGKIVGEYHSPEAFDYKKLAFYNSICQPSTFFKRGAFFDAGGIDLNLHHLMDHDLWMRMAKKNGVAHIPEILSIYRLHSESKTVSEIHGLKRNEESLKLRMMHYGWAPINHVYGYSYYLVKNKIPSFFARFEFLVIFIALLVSLVKYIKLNRGIKIDDIEIMKLSNIRKLFFGGWELKKITK